MEAQVQPSSGAERVAFVARPDRFTGASFEWGDTAAAKTPCARWFGVSAASVPSTRVPALECVRVKRRGDVVISADV
jgi:hypothetical protein